MERNLHVCNPILKIIPWHGSLEIPVWSEIKKQTEPRHFKSSHMCSSMIPVIWITLLHFRNFNFLTHCLVGLVSLNPNILCHFNHWIVKNKWDKSRVLHWDPCPKQDAIPDRRLLTFPQAALHHPSEGLFWHPCLFLSSPQSWRLLIPRGSYSPPSLSPTSPLLSSWAKTSLNSMQASLTFLQLCCFTGLWG